MTPRVPADVMRPGEFMQRLGIRKTRFGELQQQGTFRDLESPAGRRLHTTSYSRKKVLAWIEGETPVSITPKGWRPLRRL